MEEMKALSGECKYCGQIVLLTDDVLPPVDVDEEATLRCTCFEGKEYRDTVHDLEAADENIELLFVKFPDETREFLKLAARAVRNKSVKSLTAKVSENVTATIKLKGSDHIVVERRKTEKDSLETC